MKGLYNISFAFIILCLCSACARDIVDITGSISGIVKDYTTVLTIENCQVALSPSGNTVFTDANGRYTFDNLTPGTYTLTFTKIGYMDQSASVEVLAGQIISKDIQLEASEAFNVSTSILDFGDNNATLSFSLQNSTATKYDFNIVNNIEWLKLSQTNGTIQANNQLNITASVDRSIVGYGSYDKTIIINYTGKTSGNVVLRIIMQKAEIAKPTVETQDATDITANSFSIGGNISSTGGEMVSQYGHCWSYDPHPTIDDKHTDLGQTIENLRFNSKIYCSLVNTVVYVRAYAINSQGVGYGQEVQVTTPKGDDPSDNNGDFVGGNGEAHDPYQIKTAASLSKIKDYPSAYFKLVADIDMEGFPWIPIPLNTTFDGNNHTIYNLNISQYITNDKVGLFSEITKDGIVKNLTLNSVNINFPTRNYIGAIAGTCYGTVTNCHVILTKANSIVGNNYVGGLVGLLNGAEYSTIGANISSCSVSSTTSSSSVVGSEYVGGAIAHVSYEATNLVSDIHVSASIAGSNSVGGVIGYVNGQDIDKISFEGIITAISTNGENFGGLIGRIGSCILTASKANAVFEATSTTKYVGGIVGVSYGWESQITACYSQGLINDGVENSGIVGYYNGECSINNCYTLHNSPLSGDGNFSVYDLVNQFSSPINVAEIMKASYSKYSEYWDYTRTWTWKGIANGKTITAICPKLKWEK